MDCEQSLGRFGDIMTGTPCAQSIFATGPASEKDPAEELAIASPHKKKLFQQTKTANTNMIAHYPIYTLLSALSVVAVAAAVPTTGKAAAPPLSGNWDPVMAAELAPLGDHSNGGERRVQSSSCASEQTALENCVSSAACASCLNNGYNAIFDYNRVSCQLFENEVCSFVQDDCTVCSSCESQALAFYGCLFESGGCTGFDCSTAGQCAPEVRDYASCDTECSSCIVDARQAIFSGSDSVSCAVFEDGLCSAIYSDCESCANCAQAAEDYWECFSPSCDPFDLCSDAGNPPATPVPTPAPTPLATREIETDADQSKPETSSPAPRPETACDEDSVTVTLQTTGGPVVYCCLRGDGEFEPSGETSLEFQGCSPLDPESLMSQTGKADDVLVVLELTTDEYGAETSFVLTNEGTGEVLWDLPEPRESFEDSTPYTFETSVVPSGCYEFVIMDRHGDGLSVGRGGGFTLSFDGQVIAEGINFGEIEEVSFGEGCDGQ